MLARRAIYFANVFFVIFVVDLGATSSQELLDRSSSTFQGLVELCNGFINFAFVWRLLKGRCHVNQRQSEKKFFVALPWIRISERRWAA